VVGRPPFFERRENVTLLDYVRLCQELDVPASRKTEQLLLSVANVPSRMLARKDLSRAVRSAQVHRATLRQALMHLADDPRSPLHPAQQERVVGLVGVLDEIRQLLGARPTPTAGDLLAWLTDRIKYLDHFTDYYGDGWEAFDRKRAVTNFIGYARGTGLTTLEFISHIDGLDTTRGAPEEQHIVMTTVFREKGREYDYVLIPQCEEGYMPCLRETGLLVFDKAGLVEEPEPSEAIENERRLFYVAVTRARKAVYIGAPARCLNGLAVSHLPSRFVDEMLLDSTVAVMGALQRYASGAQEARSDLMGAVVEHGGIRRITRNLIAEYLKDLGDEALTGELSCIAATRAEVPFSYRYAYAPPAMPTGVRPEPQPALHQVWDDVRF
jgi:DNA helicase-2/ATP-dependent DNA helicase PcrA